MEENKKDWCKEVSEQVEKIIQTFTDEGINSGNVDYLYKLVDIHKDLANEKYWKTKEEDIEMRYRENYGRRSRDSRGRYMEGGSYGRNNYGRDNYGRGNYSGEEMIDEMYENYGNYSESRDSYNRGSYGSKEDTLESLKYMLQSVVEFMGMLKQEAGSKEEVDLIKRYAQTLSDM